MRVVMRASLVVTVLLWGIEGTVKLAPAKLNQTNMFSLTSRDTDKILVTLEQQWKRAHTLFVQRTIWKITMWRVPDSQLRSYVLRKMEYGRKFLLISADPDMPREDMPKVIEAAQLSDICVPWLFVRPQSEILEETVTYWLPVPACQAVGLLAPNDTVVRQYSWTVAPSTVPNSQPIGLHKDTEIDGLESKDLSGRKLTVACAMYTDYSHDQASCDTRDALETFHLLMQHLNVSVNFRNVYSFNEMVRGMNSNEWDVTYVRPVIRERDVFSFDFPDIVLTHERFFSLKSAHRTVTFSEVGWESSRVAVATLTLVGLVAFTLVLVTEGLRPTLHAATDTLFILLAAVLGTSTTGPTPGTRRGRVWSRALFGLWFLFIFPLSVYFRSELTSIITLKRPAERIDTLEKLEDALDGGGMAPCVYENDAAYDQLMANEPDVVYGSLMRKLQSAFKLFGSEELSTASYDDCLACALRPDRVCYTLLKYPCDLREKAPEVEELGEHFKMVLGGFRFRKSLPLYRLLRRFFLAVEEGHLTESSDAECSYSGTAAVFEVDLNSLFMQHVMLLVASSAVLVVEVLIAWYSCFNRRVSHG